MVKNALTHDAVTALRAGFTEKFGDYLASETSADALDIGDQRKMVTIGLDGPFAAPGYTMPPKLFPLLEFLLTDRLIVAAMGCVISFPGSRDQHRHRDFDNIYNPGYAYPGVDMVIARGAPYAITVGIPLVPLTERNGGTRFWPGSHLSITKPGEQIGPGIDLQAQLGTCYLFDYRILHAGIANRADKPRMLLYNIYTRPWFRDTRNYAQQAPLHIDEAALDALPERGQRLFSWALAEPGMAGGMRHGLCHCGSGLLYARCHGPEERGAGITGERAEDAERDRRPAAARISAAAKILGKFAREFV